MRIEAVTEQLFYSQKKRVKIHMHHFSKVWENTIKTFPTLPKKFYLPKSGSYTITLGKQWK